MRTSYDYLIVGTGLFGATFAYEAAKRGKTCLVIDKRPNVAGNIYTEKLTEEGLEGIAVLPEFRGLGYDLAATVLQMVPRKTVSLKVASDNPRARRLYDRLGFRETGLVSRWWKIL